MPLLAMLSDLNCETISVERNCRAACWKVNTFNVPSASGRRILLASRPCAVDAPPLPVPALRLGCTARKSQAPSGSCHDGRAKTLPPILHTEIE